jgi:hypothetical protein
MDHEHKGEDELEKHSLPGTNQAGKGPEAGEKDCDDKPAVQPGTQQDQPGKHSPSGSNQAGEGPDPTEVHHHDAPDPPTT